MEPTKQQLLAEIDDLLRTIPSLAQFRCFSDESSAWSGRASALIEKWKPGRSMAMKMAFNKTHTPPTLSRLNQSYNSSQISAGYSEVLSIIHEARHDLLFDIGETRGAVVAAGKPHAFFDEIRKIVELASADLLVVDPYLDPDFISDYLAFAKGGVRVRLLVSQYVAKLTPAAKLYALQSDIVLEIRSSKNFHDRFIFLDDRVGYQSGASFKDGGKRAPAAIIEVRDLLEASLRIYESIWAAADPVSF